MKCPKCQSMLFRHGCLDCGNYQTAEEYATARTVDVAAIVTASIRAWEDEVHPPMPYLRELVGEFAENWSPAYVARESEGEPA